MAETTELPELIGVEDVAEILGSTVKFVYLLAEQQRVPSYKLGRYLKFDKKDIAVYLAEQRRPVLSRGERMRAAVAVNRGDLTAQEASA